MAEISEFCHGDMMCFPRPPHITHAILLPVICFFVYHSWLLVYPFCLPLLLLLFTLLISLYHLHALCLTTDLDLQMKLMNRMNGSGGENLMDTAHSELGPALSCTTGGNGSLNGSFSPTVSVEQDEVLLMEDSSTSAPKEMEIFTVAAMQIPCRCTNSYAYL